MATIKAIQKISDKSKSMRAKRKLPLSKQKGSNKRKIVSKNSKSFMNEQMVGGNWAGIYELEDGSIMEVHEWDDWFDESELDDDQEPQGAVYYDIYEGGEAVDGGVCGYKEGDKFSDIAKFVESGNGQKIVRRVAGCDDQAYDEIYETLDYPDEYKKIKSKFGLKNRKKSSKSKKSILKGLKKWRR